MYKTLTEWWDMKINAINYNTTLQQGSSAVFKDPHNFKEKERAGLYGKSVKEDKNKFSGNFTGKSEVAASVIKKTVGDRIFASKSYNWLTGFAEDHNIAASAFIALILAGILRPATIMALPGKKDKEDKIYASGHSMASGLIGFVASTIVTSPWDQGVKNIMDDYKTHYDKVIENIKAGVDANKDVPPLKHKFKLLDKKYGRIVELEKMVADKAAKIEKKAIRAQIEAMQLSMKNITEWVIAIPRSILTIALIPPILKYVFGLEKKKSEPKPQQTEAQSVNQEQNVKKSHLGMENFIHKSNADVKGGAN